MIANTVANLLHHIGIDPDQIITAHAGLAGHAGCDNNDIAVCQRCIVICARQHRVKPLDGAGLRNIQRLALRYALGNIEHGDIAQFLETRQKRQRPADIASTNERYFIACHAVQLLFLYWKGP